ncbi:MAG: PilN domain-containing protein, partial [Desulfobulbaceae bacterium]|nr:PilN domain-containing protein [Desulfobulbaceae bacterium]
MVYINLLPVKEIKQRVQARQQVFLFSFIFVGLIACLVVAGIIHAGIVSGLESDVADLNREKTRYNEVIEQIKKIENDKATLQKRIDIITNLSKQSGLTVRVMDEVAKATPSDRVWLTQFSQQGGSLSLSGMALDDRTVAAYMDSLKASPWIVEVNLSSSTLSRQGNSDLKTFSITCTVAPPTAEDN